jgi:hypothetical protein
LRIELYSCGISSVAGGKRENERDKDSSSRWKERKRAAAAGVCGISKSGVVFSGEQEAEGE